MRAFLFTAFFFIISFAAFSLTASAQTSCLLYPSGSSAPSGYGVSWDVTTTARELLVKSNCPTSGNAITITIGKGNTAQFIWSKTYVYNSVALPPRWDEYTLSGTIDANGWVSNGAGAKTVTTPFVATPTNPVFFVGYVCTPSGSSFKCGCANALCTGKFWQLQAYTGNGGGSTGGSSTGGSSTGGTTGSASGNIVDIVFDNSTKRREAPGSDNWPTTWAADGNLYASWGDGGGFSGTNSSGRVQLGFARITGDWNNYVGKNIWGGFNTENSAQFGGYDYALISIDDIFWAWPFAGTSDNELIRSTNRGQSWTRTGVTLNEIGKGMCAPSFINMGRDYADAFDNYLYINGKSPCGRGTPGKKPFLLRVPKDQIANPSAYETFAGLSGGNPTWSRNISSGVPIHSNNVHWVYAINYVKGLNRFIMINNGGQDSTGGQGELPTNLEFYEAKKPWGPWRHIKTFTDWRPAGSDANNRYTFFYDIPGKWQSADGRDFTLVYTGTDANDSWNTIRGRFILD